VVIYAGLLHYGIGRMPGLYVAVYRERSARVRAVPDFVVAFSLSLKLAIILA
jgi:hypothetical protein